MCSNNGTNLYPMNQQNSQSLHASLKYPKIKLVYSPPLEPVYVSFCTHQNLVKTGLFSKWVVTMLIRTYSNPGPLDNWVNKQSQCHRNGLEGLLHLRIELSSIGLIKLSLDTIVMNWWRLIQTTFYY